jgi:hypothetical protein
MPVSRAAGNSEHSASLADVQAAEVVKFDNLGFKWMLPGKGIEQVVHHNHLIRWGAEAIRRIVQFDSRKTASMFDPSFLPSALNEDPPHGLGRGGKKVAPPVPLLVRPDKANVGFVDQITGLK